MRRTARQWMAAFNSCRTIYRVMEVRKEKDHYWHRAIGAPIGTRIVIYPGVDFGLGRYHCFPSFQAFKEYCEASQTMECTCKGGCVVVQMIRVADGL